MLDEKHKNNKRKKNYEVTEKHTVLSTEIINKVFFLAVGINERDYKWTRHFT